jgi:hypothetical protein
MLGDDVAVPDISLSNFLFLFVFCVCCFLFFVIGGVILSFSYIYYGCPRTYEHYVYVCNMHARR